MDNRKIETPAIPVDMEGVVAFGPSPSDSYRFQISLNDNKMSIWLENRKSKTHPVTNDLNLDDFVPTNGVLPQAKMVDYKKCFRKALVCPSDSEESQRDLHFLKNGHLSLEIILKLKLFDSLWLSTYEFDLNPIPLEKVDNLESNVRDLEDKMAKFEEERIKKPIYLHVTSTTSVGMVGVIPWSLVDEECFKIDASGYVEFVVPGVYMIHVLLRHITTSNATYDGEACRLLKGCEVVGHVFASSNLSYHMSSPLIVVLKMEAHEKVSVTYTGNSRAYPGSYLTAFLLG